MVEVMVLPLAEAPIRPHLADLPTVVHPTIDLLEQPMEVDLPILLAEMSLPLTIPDTLQADQAPTTPTTMPQAE
jgi:hypothetical protein